MAFDVTGSLQSVTRHLEILLLDSTDIAVWKACTQGASILGYG